MAIGVGLVIYAIAMFMVSLFCMSRVRKAADYLVAGRGLPFWVLLGTIVGTCIGTGVIIGGTGLAYKNGWAGCAYPIGLGLGTLLAGLLFGKMRDYQFMTLSEEIASYYEDSAPVVQFSNITLFVSQLCWLTVQIMGGAALLGAVTGLPHSTCTIVSGVVKAIISIPGGLKAVVYTDVLQTIILFCGFGCLTVSALEESHGLSGLRNSVPAAYVSFLGVESLGVWKIISLISALTLSVLADPGRRLTMFCARSSAAATSSMVTSGLVVIAFSVVIGITGMYAYHINSQLPVADEALPWLVMNVLPPWLAAFVVVSVFSGMSSAANGCAAAAGTFFVRHIFPLITGRFPQNPVVAVRWALTGAFTLSTGLALYTGSIVGFVLKFLPVTMSGLAIILVVGRLWKRATWQGALAAQLATPVISIAAMIFFPKSAWSSALILALPGLALHVIVSLTTPPPTRTFQEVADALTRERRAIEGVPAHPPHIAPAPLPEPAIN